MLCRLQLIIPLLFGLIVFTTDSNSSMFYINIERISEGSTIKEEEVRQKILLQYVHWQGVAYKYGGTDNRGIDCSSLMQKIFHNAFPHKLRSPLPRTTAEQIKEGKLATVVELKPGDLVFFQIGKNERHVGVYIGNEEFVHASTSKGVVISNLNTHYWKSRFEVARRIIS